jgi:hypothetical protein
VSGGQSSNGYGDAARWIARLLASCPECGAAHGENHWPGCASSPEQFSLVEALAVCRQRGWAVAHVAGEGLRPCSPDEPGAYVDLDRYYYWLRFGDADVHGRSNGTATTDL